jgi:hypothetical protein
MNQTGWLRKLFIALAFAVPVLLLAISALVRKHQFINNQGQAAIRLDLTRSNFAKLKYEPVTDTPEFKARVEGIVIKGTEFLSPLQESALKAGVYDMIMAFHMGTYEAYRNFRTPIQAEFNERAIAYHRKVLTNFYVPPDQKLPDSAESITKLIWEKDYGGNAFADYWKGVCITNVQIEVEQTNRMPSALFNFATNMDNMGVREIMPTFRFARSPEAILRDSGRLLYATSTLDIKPLEPDPAFPVFMRYYWDEASAKWLPWEMSSGNSQVRKRDPMF